MSGGPYLGRSGVKRSEATETRPQAEEWGPIPCGLSSVSPVVPKKHHSNYVGQLANFYGSMGNNITLKFSSRSGRSSGGF